MGTAFTLVNKSKLERCMIPESYLPPSWAFNNGNGRIADMIDGQCWRTHKTP